MNYNFDIMGFQETNLNWDVVLPKDSWEERTLGWWTDGHVSVHAHNKQDVISSIHQPGGTMVTSVNSAKRKVIDCGGNNGVTFRVISAYQPGDNAGAHTVFSQQRSFFDNKNDP